MMRALHTITRNSNVQLSKSANEAYNLLPYRPLLAYRNDRLLHRILYAWQPEENIRNNFCGIVMLKSHTHDASNHKLKLIKAKEAANKLCFTVSATKMEQSAK